MITAKNSKSITVSSTEPTQTNYRYPTLTLAILGKGESLYVFRHFFDEMLHSILTFSDLLARTTLARSLRPR